MHVEEYWKIHKDKRYRVSDSNGFPNSIGGHDLEMTQTCTSFYNFVREYFPINCVPGYINVMLEAMKKNAEQFESFAETILNDICILEQEKIKHEDIERNGISGKMENVRVTIDRVE